MSFTTGPLQLPSCPRTGVLRTLLEHGRRRGGRRPAHGSSETGGADEVRVRVGSRRSRSRAEPDHPGPTGPCGRRSGGQRPGHPPGRPGLRAGPVVAGGPRQVGPRRGVKHRGRWPRTHSPPAPAPERSKRGAVQGRSPRPRVRHRGQLPRRVGWRGRRIRVAGTRTRNPRRSRRQRLDRGQLLPGAGSSGPRTRLRRPAPQVQPKR